MFSKNQNKDSKAAAFADKVSIIAAGMQVSGDIASDGDIRIDGTVNGNVVCKSRVVIIAGGRVTGDIQAVNVDVHGHVQGNITARELLSLKANCKIDGNLVTEKLQIEPNASFNGHCTMNFRQRSASMVSEEGLLLDERQSAK